MKYTTPVAEMLALEAASVILASVEENEPATPPCDLTTEL